MRVTYEGFCTDDILSQNNQGQTLNIIFDVSQKQQDANMTLLVFVNEVAMNSEKYKLYLLRFMKYRPLRDGWADRQTTKA